MVRLCHALTESLRLAVLTLFISPHETKQTNWQQMYSSNIMIMMIFQRCERFVLSVLTQCSIVMLHLTCEIEPCPSVGFVNTKVDLVITTRELQQMMEEEATNISHSGNISSFLQSLISRPGMVNEQKGVSSHVASSYKGTTTYIYLFDG